MKLLRHVAAVLALASFGAATPVAAGDCTGHVVGLSPLAAYDHDAGLGFLAVRAGPGIGHAQLGELYLGDEISVWDRQGSWFRVQCMTGRCQSPLWGQANPNGWVYGLYLDIGGVCP